jgi:hypothetical protein
LRGPTLRRALEGARASHPVSSSLQGARHSRGQSRNGLLHEHQGPTRTETEFLRAATNAVRQVLRTFFEAGRNSPEFHASQEWAGHQLVSPDRIDFIAAYCDRWCERCLYTDRCSAFACRIAQAMCGEIAAGIELAVGAAHPVEGKSPETASEKLLAQHVDVEPTPEEIAEIKREATACRVRLAAKPITGLAAIYMRRSTAWLDQHRARLASAGDPVVQEALELVAWDTYLIGAKIHRALHGRDGWERGDKDFDDPVQNDWNGSAKVALISLKRSESAWRLLADATGDATTASLADCIGGLRRAVESEFPKATSFIRPGFDQPGR